MARATPIQDRGAGFDVAAREAEILGKPQRIESLASDEFDADAKALVVEIRAALGLETAEIPEIFGLMLKHPGLFRCQIEMARQLFQGALSPRERELAILRGAWIMGAPFEWSEHVVIAKRCGLSADEIARVIEGGRSESWSRHEAALLLAVDELFTRFMISDETWTVLAETWGEQQLMEFPVLVGVYAATAMQQNSLRVRTEGGKPGLTSR